MTINRDGNVGIGTTSPVWPLHIHTPSDTQGQLILTNSTTGTGTSSGTQLMAYQSNTYLTNRENGAIYFRNNSTNTRMYISADGNVGIGTTSSGALLDVNGSMRAAYNSNTTSYFGRAAVGYCGHSDCMSIAHLDKNTKTSYALLQTSSGDTLLNAANKCTLYVRINNTSEITITSGTVSVSSSLTCGSFNTSGSITMGGSQFYLNRSGGTKIKYKTGYLNWENNDGTATKEHDWRLSEYDGTAAQVYFRNSVGNNRVNLRALSVSSTSDDRLKTNEILLTNATETIMKLKPQLYDHYANERLKTESMKSVGLIAQEIYYDAPELRDFIVHLPVDTSGNRCTPIEVDLSNQDPANDPDYEALGWTKDDYASVDYIKLIPYLIKSNQEQQEEINTLKTQLTDVLTRLSALENN